MWARALDISGVNFCPGTRFCKFCSGIRFLAIFDQKCVIFDKSEKSDLLAENF